MHPLDWFSKWAIYSPSKIAVKDMETARAFTFSQMNNLGNYFAAKFEKLGIRQGDRVALLSENSLEHLILFCVAQKTGIIFVPLNYRLTTTELNFMLGNSSPTLIISEEKYQNKILEAADFLPIKHKFSLMEFSVEADNFISSGEIASQISLDFDEELPLFLLYTSGTTAFPKASIYTHKMLFWNAINTEMRLDITSEDITVSCMPLFHTGGWNVFTTPFILHGATSCFAKSFNPDKILEWLDKEEATIFTAVPTMLKMMTDSPVFHHVGLKKLRYFVIGGEAMPIPLIETWHNKGILIRQGFGLTEVGPSVTSLDHTDAIRKQGSIGTPNFYIEAKLVDENGAEVPDGEPGELLLKGPAVTPGYWLNPEETAKTIINGWFHTGDLVKKDAEGYFYVVDRIKNMYISGGENVYPAEVEYLFRSHPEVDAVAIIGISDEKWGETGKAFVVRKNDSQLSEADLLRFCEGKLARYKIPKSIVFIDELPKNSAGKIDRKMLKNWAK